MVKMNKKSFERLNFLSEKSLNYTISYRERKEFKTLLNEWNTAFELDQLSDLYSSEVREQITH